MKQWRHVLLALSVLGVLAAAPWPANAAQQPLVSVQHEGIHYSESVYPYKGGLFISNFGSQSMNPQPAEMAGNIIYQKDGQQQTIVSSESGLLHKPTAMLAKDHYLFVCDDTRLLVFDLQDRAAKPQVITFAPDDKVFNDIAADGNTLYVTITNTGRIYTLDISHPSQMAQAKPQLWLNLPGPNGIVIGKDKTMYVASIPADYQTVTPDNVIYRISDLSHPVAERFLDVPGLYDGVALSDDNQTLYVSDWLTASVTAIDTGTKKMRILYQEKGIGPADIAQAQGILYIPEIPGSRLIAIDTNK